MDRDEFRSAIYAYYKAEGRSFPWRATTPWGVLISEFMLQQTQTERVIPFWRRWMEIWPEPAALANAPMEEVLREWNGLGYNSRAKRLKACAEIIARRYGGKTPDTPAELQTLPGIGSYTAGAVACFAYNYPAAFIETNIRAVIIHFFFQNRETVNDKEIFPILEETLDRENPRIWNWALMDYGAALKKLVKNPSRKSAHYAKQSRFEGSQRQIRGKVIKSLAFEGPASREELALRTGIPPEDIYQTLLKLEEETMVAETAGKYRIGE